MLTCSNCGASVREGARFCTTCGTRLNDPVTTDATSVWATPVPSDTAASTDEAFPDPVWTDAADRAQAVTDDERSGEVDAAPAAEIEPASEPDVAAVEQPAPTPSPSTTDDAFNWSWGSPSNADEVDDAASNRGADEVEVESGVVPDQDDASATGSDSNELVDATEIEILEVDDSVADAEVDETPTDPDPDPESSDALLVVEDEEDERQEESETLAAWAEQWQSPDSDNAPGDDTPGILPAPTATPEREQTAAAAPGEFEEEEDTVARAERLISELRAIIPTLARPMVAAPDPVVATNTIDTGSIADELEGAARSGQFDDLRDVLQAARANPRDVDTMLTLSGRVDRLLELLDDRDNLARVSEDAAERLRPTASEPES